MEIFFDSHYYMNLLLSGFKIFRCFTQHIGCNFNLYFIKLSRSAFIISAYVVSAVEANIRSLIPLIL